MFSRVTEWEMIQTRLRRVRLLLSVFTDWRREIDEDTPASLVDP